MKTTFLNTMNALSEKTVITVGTHNGLFHGDEVCAIALLKIIFKNKIFSVIRSRNKEELDRADFCLDVTSNIPSFDHHQKVFACRDNGEKYSSIGFVFNALGDRLVPEELKEYTQKFITDLDTSIFRFMDAADNGVLPKSNLEYGVPSISHIISGFNGSIEDSDNNFMAAVDWAELALSVMISTELRKLSSYKEMKDVMDQQKDSYILVLEKGGPWLDVLLNNWEEYHFQLVIYPDASAENQYRIQTTPASKEDTFSMSCPMPEEYRGYRWDDTNKVFIAGQKLVFCHPTGFICGVKSNSVDNVIEVAKKILK